LAFTVVEVVVVVFEAKAGALARSTLPAANALVMISFRRMGTKIGLARSRLNGV
jgi:hypothetical protein